MITITEMWLARALTRSKAPRSRTNTTYYDAAFGEMVLGRSIELLIILKIERGSASFLSANIVNLVYDVTTEDQRAAVRVS